MKTISIRLDDDTEAKLRDLLAALKANQTDLIKRLISERWVLLQMGKTFLERRGGHPEHLLSGPADLSEREVRKRTMAKNLLARSARRKRPR
jgi:predicted transcriptional regulator